ncbi:MAG: ABC transporter permease, partial [Angelakisella sp.]
MEILGGILRAIPGAASQGVLWGIMTLGVYLTYKVLGYSDLTVDGSFATGGAVSAILIMNGMNPFLTLIFATAAGILCGIMTGLLHTWFKIPAILSGILSMIALYSINVRIMDNKANLPLLGEKTVISIIQESFGVSMNVATLIVGAALGAVLIALLYWFFGTEVGSAIRATGNNEAMVRALGA